MDDTVAISVFGKRPFPHFSLFVQSIVSPQSGLSRTGFTKLVRHIFIIPGTSLVSYWNDTLQDSSGSLAFQFNSPKDP